jgi:hypothetical protein
MLRYVYVALFTVGFVGLSRFGLDFIVGALDNWDAAVKGWEASVVKIVLSIIVVVVSIILLTRDDRRKKRIENTRYLEIHKELKNIKDEIAKIGS